MRHSLSTRHLLALTTALSVSLLLAHTAVADGFSYAEAAKPYAGVTIRVVDEVTPLQDAVAALVPEFTEETGINVDYVLMNHYDLINKGLADVFAGLGTYDGVQMHSFQLGPALAADALMPFDKFLADPKLTNPDLDTDDFIQRPYLSTVMFGDHQYGFLTWNYNYVYWTRADLMHNEAEQADFEARYDYPLAPPKTLEQTLDIAQFFTRKRGEVLAGKKLDSDFYGIVFEGLKGQTGAELFIGNILHNFGGNYIDSEGRPSFDTPVVVDALKYWVELWKYTPPGNAEYSVIDVPTVMGNGIAAQSLAYSDFVLGIDRPGASPLAGQFLYAPIPVKEGADSAVHAAESEPTLITISKASKHPEATYLFLEWLVEKQQQEVMLQMGNGGVPIRNSSWADMTIMQEQNPTLLVAMKESLKVARAKPKMPAYFNIIDALSDVVQRVGTGQLSPEDGAKEGQQALVAICGDSCLLAPQ